MTRNDGTPSPRVSVVVVNYNGGEVLLRCLEALFTSTLPLEVILCDNASKDDSTREAAHRFPSLRLRKNIDNLGFAVAVNQGLSMAQSDILLLLNPDCIVQPDTLERMVAILDAHPEVGMAGCRILNPDGSEQRGCRRHLPNMGNSFSKATGRQKEGRNIDLHDTPLPREPQPVEAISGAFMLIRRTALESVGPLDEGYFLHCEDLDWCKRFHDQGWKILFVPQISIVHYQGTCSSSHPVRVSWYKHRGMVRYYRKHLANNHNPLVRASIIAGIYLRFLFTLVVRS